MEELYKIKTVLDSIEQLTGQLTDAQAAQIAAYIAAVRQININKLQGLVLLHTCPAVEASKADRITPESGQILQVLADSLAETIEQANSIQDEENNEQELQEILKSNNIERI